MKGQTMTMTHELAAMKSAFVIKKGAYEKLVCRGCAEHLMDLAYTAYTPVTLSCEAFCSICDEAI